MASAPKTPPHHRAPPLGRGRLARCKPAGPAARPHNASTTRWEPMAPRGGGRYRGFPRPAPMGVAHRGTPMPGRPVIRSYVRAAVDEPAGAFAYARLAFGFPPRDCPSHAWLTRPAPRSFGGG